MLKSRTRMEVERFNVLGVGISVLNQDSAREFLFQAVREGRRGYVTINNVHTVSEAQPDERLRRIFADSLLSTPDGMPLVWLGKFHGYESIGRVYGPDLLLNLCEHSRAFGFRHFFYGGKPGVAEELAGALATRFPALNIVGTYTPPFRPLNQSEREELAGAIRETRPDFVWVGIGSPKQEYFMSEFCPLLPEAKIFIGIGAGFDFLSGRVRQAPRWMMRSGLEWIFRLTQEPRRLWYRYLVLNPLFLGRTALQLSGLRKYPIPDEVRPTPSKA